MKYAAFLRAINVGGYALIKMQALQEMFSSLGFKNVKTYIQSGNIIFETTKQKTDSLRKKIEAHLKKTLGYPVAVFIRTESEINDIIKNNPFDETKLSKTLYLYLAFLEREPSKELKEGLLSANNDIENYFINGTNCYCLVQRDKMKNPFSNNLLEKKLKLSATTRNWNTIKKIKDLF